MRIGPSAGMEMHALHLAAQCSLKRFKTAVVSGPLSFEGMLLPAGDKSSSLLLFANNSSTTISKDQDQQATLTSLNLVAVVTCVSSTVWLMATKGLRHHGFCQHQKRIINLQMWLDVRQIGMVKCLLDHPRAILLLDLEYGPSMIPF
jgi:hypothetical protein